MSSAGLCWVAMSVLLASGCRMGMPRPRPGEPGRPRQPVASRAPKHAEKLPCGTLLLSPAP